MITGSTASSTTNIVQIQKIASATMGSSSISFSNIPQTYDSLLILANAALSSNISSWVESYPTCRFNNDSGANYSRLTYVNNASNSQSNNTGMDVALPGPNSTPWKRGSTVYMYIPEYASTSKYKSMDSWCTRVVQNGNNASGSINESFVYQWRSTSGITSFSITTGLSGGSPTGNFTAESTIDLYGIRLK